MKIVYFVDGFDRGGIEIVVSILANNISRFGNQIHLICLYEDKLELESDLLEDIYIHCLPFKSKKKNKIKYISSLSKLINLLKKIKPDIIHAHNASFSYFYLSIAVCLSNVKSVNIRSLHFSGFFLEKKTIGDKVRYLFDKLASELLSTSIISVGPAVEMMAKKLYPRNQHYTITNGIDTKGKFLRKDICKSTLGINVDRKVVVYVARICPGKNHDTLIKAWEIVANYDKTSLLVLVGDGPSKENIQNIVKVKHIEDNVRFTGSISNVEDFLSIADLGVFPSASEGLGLGLIEMMSIGLPVVASKIPACLHIIRDKDNGILYETYDYKDLANKIITVLYDNELKCRLGNKARSFVDNYYSIESMIEEHRKLYCNLLNILFK